MPYEAETPFGQALFLEVQVNHVAVPDLVKLVASGDTLWADRQALIDLGLRMDAIPAALWLHGQLRLDALPDTEIAYDRLQQRLSIVVPVHLLDRTTAHRAQPSRTDNPPADPSQPGFLLNYDLYLQHEERRSQRSKSLSGWTEWRFFHRLGVFSHTQYSQLAHRGVGSNVARHQRLDTTWRSDFPEHALSVVLGDTVTSGPAWSRPARLGGLRVGTDFGLQPYRSTRPLTAFQGQAMLPSTVDVYVNGMLQEHLQVLPGQFITESLVSIHGAGMAQMVITDISGHRRTLDIPLYGTLDLLQRGLTDWSVEMGALRSSDGLGRPVYGSQVVANGSWRHGWSDATTLESHAALGRGTRVLGLGVITRLGIQGGMLNASLASSAVTGKASGRQVTAGYQWSARPWRLSLRSQRTSPYFKDLSTLNGVTDIRSSDRVFLGFGEAGWDAGLTAMRQQDQQRNDMKLFTLSMGWQTTTGWRLALGWSHVRATRTDRRLSFTLTVPLKRELSFALSTQKQGNTNVSGWELRQSPSNIDEWSWRMAQYTPGGAAQLGAHVNTAGGRWDGSIDRIASDSGGTSTSVRTSFGGAVVFMAGRAFLTAPVDDAFALVSTNGLPGLPVKLENRPVGQTDSKGHLLVNRLSAHQRNQLSVDVLDLPYEVSVDTTMREAIPQRRQGTKVDFDFHRVVSVRATLRDGAKRLLPPGSTVVLEASPHTAEVARHNRMNLFPQVGHNGGIFIENPVPGMALRVTTPQGGECRVQLPSHEPGPAIQTDLGELTCQ